MKKAIKVLCLLLILSLSGCSIFSRYDSSKSSLLINYFHGPYQWGGIELGKSTLEESLFALEKIPEVVSDSISTTQRFTSIDNAICHDFNKGFRESGLCIWFSGGKAEVLEFFGAYLSLSEIQKHLGGIDEIAVLRIHDHNSKYIRYYGRSKKSGLYLMGTHDPFFGKEEIDEININSNSVFYVSLTSAEGLDLAFKVSAYENVYDFLMNEDAFIEWQGYGEYQVQQPDIVR